MRALYRWHVTLPPASYPLPYFPVGSDTNARPEYNQSG
jgi:hypothetical protein